jgi:hypothetical protein
MTKHEELAAWEAFAASLPSESYSKGALYSVLTELRHAEASRTAVGIIEDAKAKAERMLRSQEIALQIQLDSMLQQLADAEKSAAAAAASQVIIPQEPA